MNHQRLALALAGSIATAMTAAAPAPAAGGVENCYGVSLKGQNDCAGANHSCAGQATTDYDGASWKAVPAGTCTSLKTPFGPGSLVEIKRPA